MKRLFLLFAVSLMLCASAPVAGQTQSLSSEPASRALTTENRYPLIPYPDSLAEAPGTFFIGKQTTLSVQAEAGRFADEAAYLSKLLRGYLGAEALQPAGDAGMQGAARRSGRTASAKGAAGAIVLREDPAITAPEGYRLSVTPQRIILSAASASGMFYAIQTLRQLLPSAVENGHGTRLFVPAVEIEDHPAFVWRGMMLDVSRHFFSTAYLRKYIDMMAMYKFNRLHLHLTDDQGWRIEIKKYPLLTEKSAWRTFNNQDSACMLLEQETGNPDFAIDPSHIRKVNGHLEYGGFYTQAEMRDVIRYAASRHVEIVPEIDMPGHMMAAEAVYPWLTCDGRPVAPGQSFSSPICPCKDSALQFAKDVFGEIADLFPGPYIHIGGDEVEKRDWEQSGLVQRFMADHRIANTDSLQSYFNDVMEAFFRSKGKTLVGWDEIVAGGIDSAAVVMFWRPWARTFPARATANGNGVVMSPDGPLYFDGFPDRNTLSSVYHYDPVDTIYEMNPAQQERILGVQANLWTERVPSGDRADYMVMPRMTALAELGWTHRDLYNSYLKRLEGQYDRLDRLNVHYRLPDLPDVADRRVFIDTASFMISSPSPKLTLHYTTDGTSPVITSPLLQAPVKVDHTLSLRVAAFTADGRRGDVQAISYERQPYAAPIARPSQALRPGLNGAFYRREFRQAADLLGDIAGDGGGRPDSALALPGAFLPATFPQIAFGVSLRGYINVPETGIYSFFLTSDDGSVLKIADRLVVDNDGFHSALEKSGQVALAKGLHPFSIGFMNGGSEYSLGLKYSKDNGIPEPVPNSWFSCSENGGKVGY